VRFLIDANLPRSIVGVLTQLGHESLFARDIGLAHAPDRVVAERAQTTQAVLLTRDLDFADVRNYPPEQYNGIVVFRFADDVVAKEIARIAELFLSEPNFLRQLSGRLAIVESDRVRFRPALRI
jgi:predicted nuclease of predicted toxin-antitoxin system